jgi:putative SOS response-associated peptidase YedK
MCGRFTLKTPKEIVARQFGVEIEDELAPRYNIAPTQTVATIRATAQSGESREFAHLKWGLIPSWARDASMGARLINARSETVTEKPSFREAFKRRRAIIPADGIYEWQRTEDKKQPYFIRMRDGSLFGFAGLWDRWRKEGEIIESCSILTTSANEVFRPVHERIPVVLQPESYSEWLDTDVRGVEALKELLRPYPSSEMIAYPVSIRVNSPQHQGAELIERLATNSASAR